MRTFALLCCTFFANPAAATAPGAEGVAPVSDSDRAQARTLYEEGVGLFQGREWAGAMELFASAYALDPSPILLYNLARAAEENGVAEGAVGHYRAYLEQFPDAEDRPEVERRIRILDAVLRNARRGSIAVVEVPAGARVLINEKPAGDADEEGKWRRDPGTYALKVESDEGSYTTQVEVKPGELTTVSLALPEPEDRNELVIAGWSAVGVGAVIAATGFVYWADAHDAADSWNREVNRIAGGDTTQSALARKRGAEEDVVASGDTALVLWTVGGLAAATGAGLLLYEAMSEQPAPQASLVILPQGVGVSGKF